MNYESPAWEGQDDIVSSGVDYKPNKNDIDSSDSNSDILIDGSSESDNQSIIGGLKSKLQVRDKAWKKKKSPKRFAKQFKPIYKTKDAEKEQLESSEDLIEKEIMLGLVEVKN